MKKEEAKKKAEDKAKAKAAQQAQAKPQPQFDPNKIAALLDKREPTRQASAAETLSTAPSLGKSDGKAAQLSQSEIDALRKRLGECWNPPAGAADGGQLKVVLRVLFKPDATVASAAATGRGDGFAVRAGDGGKRQARDPDAASRSPCCGPIITSNGKTSRSPSIPAKCSAVEQGSSGHRMTGNGSNRSPSIRSTGFC